MKRPGHRALLGLLLVLSLVLRVWLGSHGGQGYWPDENIRYGETQQAAAHLMKGEWTGARNELLGHPDHLLFRWVALPPALLDQRFGFNPVRTSAYFSLFSVAIIALVWGIARRAGADEREALLAAFLAACANSLFFYARHFFPYDAALAFMLFGLWTGLGIRPRHAFLAGVAVGAGFLTYNGYWLPGAIVLALIVPGPGLEGRRWPVRALLAGGGFAATVGGMVLAARWSGHDLIRGWQGTAGTITQGDFGGGWRVVVDYLWFADTGLAVLWLGALGVGLAWSWRRPDFALRRWVLGIVLLFLGLVALSDVIHKFVVYGRLVRPVVPLLCLLAARVVVMGSADARRRWLVPACAGLALGAAAWNFAGPLRQEFPPEFRLRAGREARARQAIQPGAYRTVRAEHLWGADLTATLPPHTVLLRAAHPLQFRPYQYEGFSAAQRALLDRGDIAMKLIRFGTSDTADLGALHPLWGREVGPLKLQLKFPDGELGQSEPLVTTGTTTQGDFLYVSYQDSAHARFGFDHWGISGFVTESIPIDYAQEHEVIVSLGSLLPSDPQAFAAAPWAARLRRLAFVALDGRPVLSFWSDFHPSERGDVSIGSNYIGGSTAQQSFSGRLTHVARAEPAELARLVPAVRLAFSGRDASWDGTPGPWRLRARLGPAEAGQAEPLFSARVGDQSETLLVERPDARTLRLRLERGGGVYRSDPVEIDPAVAQEFEFSSGALYPEESHAFFDQHPQWRPLKRLVFVKLNGRPVFLRCLTPLPGRTAEAVLGSLAARGISARENFSGLVESMAAVDPEAVLRSGTQLANMVAARPAEWGGYPGPVRLRIRMPREFPPGGAGEPLLVSGVTGAGDFLAIFPQPDGRVRFSVDHWGTGGPPASEPVTIAPGSVCELVVSAGFLWPPADAPLYRDHPEWRQWRARLWVAMDGRTVLDARAPAHATTPAQLTAGVNFIGGSTTSGSFSGVIEKVETVEPADLDPRP